MYRPMLTLAALFLLTSCANWKVRTIAPEPPRIDCSERAPAEPLPRNAAPTFPPLPAPGAPYDAWRAYLATVHARWGSHTLRAFGAYESAVAQRVATAECLDRERDAGRIR